MAHNITKNQHYVPRCILKQFTNNKNKTHIMKFSLSDGEIEGKNIEKVCALKYFYGKEQDIENLYELAENEMAPIIDEKLRKGDTKLSKEELIHIKNFLAAQSTRTVNDTKLYEDVAKGAINTILKSINENVTSEYSLQFNNRKLKIQNVKLGTIKSFSFVQMDFVLLKASPFTDFIIGQDPVIEFNPFLWQREKINNKGFGLLGYTVILPISPKYCICLYDSKIYKTIGKNGIYKLSFAQTNELNIFQILNTNEYILFSKHLKIYLKCLLSISRKFEKENKIITTEENRIIHTSMNNSNKSPVYSIFKQTDFSKSIDTKEKKNYLNPIVKEAEDFFEMQVNETIESRKKTESTVSD